MKKSEIRELLKDGVDWQEDDIEVIVDHILEVIEHAGMAAPVMLKEIPSHMITKVDVTNKSITLMETGQVWSTVNEWEPED